MAARNSTARTVALLSAASFLGGMALRLCDGLLPRLARDFSITPGTAGWVVIAFSLAYGAMQLLSGPLGDRFGKALMVTLAIAACGVMSGLAAFAPGFDSLLAARIGWGIAAAGIIPLAMAWVGDAVDFEERQPVLAKLLLGTLSGMVAGQFAGGVFGDSAPGWRGAFGLMAVAYLAVAVLIFAVLQPHRALPHAAAAPQGVQAWGIVFASSWSRCVLAAAFIEGVLLLGPMAYLPAMLHQRFGLSLSVASSFMALYAVGGLIYAAAARWIVARMGQVRMLGWGGVVIGAGSLAWLVSPVAWTAAPVALIVGFGTYLFHNTLQTHATQMAPSVRGTAVALFAASLFNGGALGAWLAGILFDQAGAAAMLVPSIVLMPLAGAWIARALRARATAQPPTPPSPPCT